MLMEQMKQGQSVSTSQLYEFILLSSTQVNMDQESLDEECGSDRRKTKKKEYKRKKKEKRKENECKQHNIQNALRLNYQLSSIRSIRGLAIFRAVKTPFRKA